MIKLWKEPMMLLEEPGSLIMPPKSDMKLLKGPMDYEAPSELLREPDF